MLLRLPTANLFAALLVIAASATGCASLRRYKIVPDSVAACRDLQREGAAALEQGEGDRAKKLLTKAVSTSPTDIDARRQLAEVLWDSGRRAEAIEHIEAAIKLDPSQAPTIVRAGEMLAASGQIDRAFVLAEKAVMLDGSLSGAWALRGRVYRHRGNNDRALADLQHALCHAPDCGDTLLEIAELQYQLGRPQRALTTLHQLLDAYPTGDEPQRVLWLEGLAYDAVERPADAAASLLAASTRGQPHPELLYHLAKVEAAMGRATAASDAARRALALDGGHQGSRTLLAELQEAGSPTLRR